jgi:glutaredoxin
MRTSSALAIKFVATYALITLASGIFGVHTASAQQLYRSVGPDGKVTFSDRPPVEAAAKPAAKAGSAPAANGTAATAPAATGGGGALPYELRQVASRYPVTLYTGENCVPCGTGRAMLQSRGVPFTEKTVSSNEDIQALQRISGDASLPFATIGGQQLKGYSETEWSQFLDAAGYPKQSQLPRSYRQAAATPLVAAKAAAPAPVAAASAAPAAAAPAPVPVTPPPTATNPAGIKF